ncbi:MAG: hypothetical protein EPO25_14370 [Gammaproteobacteria bacterium]|nr:MAG: hypothetical protein EPO25_14370 [Gammaproteobacteria bacterium]
MPAASRPTRSTSCSATGIHCAVRTWPRSRRCRGSRKRCAGRITIDLDPTDDPTHGAQQLSFFNGHYDSWCYLPVAGFLTFNDEADQYLFACVLRPRRHREPDQGAAPWARDRPYQLQPLPRQPVARPADGCRPRPVPGIAAGCCAHHLPPRPGQHPARTSPEARRLDPVLGAAHRAAPARRLHPPPRLADHRPQSRRRARVALSD